MTLEQLKTELERVEFAIFCAYMSDSYAITLSELATLEPKRDALKKAIKALEA